MSYNCREIVTEISPEMKQINSFLNGDFQSVLNTYGLRYEFESWRTIKTGKTYDDQIRVGVKRNFWRTNNVIVADIIRRVSEDKNISLEIRVLDQDYSETIKKTVGQYHNIAVKMYF